MALLVSCRGPGERIEIASLWIDKDRCEVHRLDGVFQWTAKTPAGYNNLNVEVPEARMQRIESSPDRARSNPKLIFRGQLGNGYDHWRSDQCYEFQAPSPKPVVTDCSGWENGSEWAPSYAGRMSLPSIENDVSRYNPRVE